MRTLREKIWYFLVDAKTNEFLASSLTLMYQKFDLVTNILIVFATSASIGAWAIWKELSILWTIIICISQVIIIIKPYFLFPKYIKIFNEKSIYWQQLSLDLEELWFLYNNAEIAEENAGKKFFDLKRKSLTFDCIPDDIIFFKHKMNQRDAEKTCEVYLQKI
jgi:hypothetical protein